MMTAIRGVKQLDLGYSCQVVMQMVFKPGHQSGPFLWKHHFLISSHDQAFYAFQIFPAFCPCVYGGLEMH